MSSSHEDHIASTFTVTKEQTVVSPLEEQFVMSRHELTRFRRATHALHDHLSIPVSDAPTWAAFFFGAGVAGILGLVTVVSSVATPSVSLLVTMWVTTLVGLLGGGLCLLFGHGAKHLRARSIDDICAEFDEIEKRAFPPAQVSQ